MPLLQAGRAEKSSVGESQFEQKAEGNSVKKSQLALALLLQWPLCEGTQLARLSVTRCASWVISVYSRDMLRRINQPDFGNTPIFPHLLSQIAIVCHSFVKMLAGKN